jgi:formate-dependent nitrite reductase membrane component NrfD
VKLIRRKGIDPETRETFQPRLWLIVASLAAIVAYLVAFVAENHKSVKVHFVFYTGHTSVIWLIVGALALIIAYLVAFVAENNKSVKVHFVFYTGQTSVIWLVLLSLAVGLVAGLLLSQLERRRRRHQRG